MCQKEKTQTIGIALQRACVALGEAISALADADDGACQAIHRSVVAASKDVMAVVMPLTELTEGYCTQYDIPTDVINEFNAKHHRVIDEVVGPLTAGPGVTVVPSIEDLLQLLGLGPMIPSPDDGDDLGLPN